MSRDIFPIVEIPAAAALDELPMAKEWAWDFETDQPIFRGGAPMQVTGSEAVKVWAYNALRTPRYQHEIWTPAYGCELDRLVGQPFASDTKLAEAVRYIRECLLASPYITDVTVSNLSLMDSTLSADVNIKTIYGEEASLHV